MTPNDFVESATRAVAACDGLPAERQAALLAADGLLGIIAGEAVGGLAMPVAFAVPVAGAGGGTLLRFPLVETLLLAAFAAEAQPVFATALVAGETVATIAWSGAIAASGTGEALKLSGSVGRAPLADVASKVLVRLADGRGALVGTAAAGVSVVASADLDLVRPEFTLRLADVTVGPADILDAAQMQCLDGVAALLRAAAILGASETCLGAAVEHATTRKQFGKPLIANQAIRHHLARHKMGLESARVALLRAVENVGDERVVRGAFATAVNTGILVAEGAIQIHGGMGFTWEVPLHHYLRHIRALDMQADSGANLDHLGEAYIAAITPMADQAA